MPLWLLILLIAIGVVVGLLLTIPIGALVYLLLCWIVDAVDETVYRWKHRNHPPYELREPPKQ